MKLKNASWLLGLLAALLLAGTLPLMRGMGIGSYDNLELKGAIGATALFLIDIVFISICMHAYKEARWGLCETAVMPNFLIILTFSLAILTVFFWFWKLVTFPEGASISWIMDPLLVIVLLETGPLVPLFIIAQFLCFRTARRFQDRMLSLENENYLIATYDTSEQDKVLIIHKMGVYIGRNLVYRPVLYSGRFLPAEIFKEAYLETGQDGAGNGVVCIRLESPGLYSESAAFDDSVTAECIFKELQKYFPEARYADYRVPGDARTT